MTIPMAMTDAIPITIPMTSPKMMAMMPTTMVMTITKITV